MALILMSNKISNTQVESSKNRPSSYKISINLLEIDKKSSELFSFGFLRRMGSP